MIPHFASLIQEPFWVARLGAGNAALLSLAAAAGLTAASAEWEGLSEGLYEGVTLLLAARQA
jgi:hypothetical protein